MQDGIYLDLPDVDYRKAAGVSQTQLKELARSPAHYAEAIEHPEEPTPDMIFGRIAHQVLFLPDQPFDWAVKPPGLDGRTREGKAWVAATAGKQIIEHTEWLKIEGAVHAARNHSMLGLALDGALREVSCFHRFELGGSVMRKGRIDAVPMGPALVDCKFVRDAREESFQRLAFSLKYYLQAAYYLDLWNENVAAGGQPVEFEIKDRFIFFAIEKEPPFAVNVFQVDGAAIDRGRSEYIDLLTTYMDCQGRRDWSAYHPRSPYSPEVKVLTLPVWANKRQPSVF